MMVSMCPRFSELTHSDEADFCGHRFSTFFQVGSDVTNNGATCLPLFTEPHLWVLLSFFTGLFSDGCEPSGRCWEPSQTPEPSLQLLDFKFESSLSIWGLKSLSSKNVTHSYPSKKHPHAPVAYPLNPASFSTVMFWLSVSGVDPIFYIDFQSILLKSSLSLLLSRDLGHTAPTWTAGNCPHGSSRDSSPYHPLQKRKSIFNPILGLERHWTNGKHRAHLSIALHVPSPLFPPMTNVLDQRDTLICYCSN